jgi:hypothetical protein
MNHLRCTHNENTAYQPDAALAMSAARHFFFTAALFSILSLFFILQSCTSSSHTLPEISEAVTVTPLPAAVQFSEIWGYVMKGRENELNYDSPLSDIGYFAAEVNCYGEITDVPDRTKFNSFSGRIHIVTSCDSRGLTHFILLKDSVARTNLINSLAALVSVYDGIQIDYELVPQKDGDAYLSFLKELKKKLGAKTLSVAVPARTRTISDDVYQYAQIASSADRVIVMAYDEHWSASSPGAIASADWCAKVAAYAASVIPHEKLVMGIPFYGRTWGDDTTANKAWYYSGTSRIIRENNVKRIKRGKDGIPYYSFTSKQIVTGWFEDETSLSAKCSLYSGKNISSVAFWRIGQEDPAFWQHITLSPQQTKQIAETKQESSN